MESTPATRTKMGLKLRAARLKAKLTQESCATQAEVSVARWSGWERGAGLPNQKAWDIVGVPAPASCVNAREKRETRFTAYCTLRKAGWTVVDVFRDTMLPKRTCYNYEKVYDPSVVTDKQVAWAVSTLGKRA